jgi:hypothetical protein
MPYYINVADMTDPSDPRGQFEGDRATARKYQPVTTLPLALLYLVLACALVRTLVRSAEGRGVRVVGEPRRR